MVTNMDWGGEKSIHRLHERCGKSEEAHAVMKDDIAGGKLIYLIISKMMQAKFPTRKISIWVSRIGVVVCLDPAIVRDIP
ncbi:MAG: hypothetical protein JW902_13980 [Syntrophaceae bacterium]|nr:hypothetical protein [Syntrophaceae bacterium]